MAGTVTIVEGGKKKEISYQQLAERTGQKVAVGSGPVKEVYRPGQKPAYEYQHTEGGVSRTAKLGAVPETQPVTKATIEATPESASYDDINYWLKQRAETYGKTIQLTPDIPSKSLEREIGQTLITITPGGVREEYRIIEGKPLVREYKPTEGGKVDVEATKAYYIAHGAVETSRGLFMPLTATYAVKEPTPESLKPTPEEFKETRIQQLTEKVAEAPVVERLAMGGATIFTPYGPALIASTIKGDIAEGNRIVAQSAIETQTKTREQFILESPPVWATAMSVGFGAGLGALGVVAPTAARVGGLALAGSVPVSLGASYILEGPDVALERGSAMIISAPFAMVGGLAGIRVAQRYVTPRSLIGAGKGLQESVWEAEELTGKATLTGTIKKGAGAFLEERGQARLTPTEEYIIGEKTGETLLEVSKPTAQGGASRTIIEESMTTGTQKLVRIEEGGAITSETAKFPSKTVTQISGGVETMRTITPEIGQVSYSTTLPQTGTHELLSLRALAYTMPEQVTVSTTAPSMSEVLYEAQQPLFSRYGAAAKYTMTESSLALQREAISYNMGQIVRQTGAPSMTGERTMYIKPIEKFSPITMKLGKEAQLNVDMLSEYRAYLNSMRNDIASSMSSGTKSVSSGYTGKGPATSGLAQAMRPATESVVLGTRYDITYLPTPSGFVETGSIMSGMLVTGKSMSDYVLKPQVEPRIETRVKPVAIPSIESMTSIGLEEMAATMTTPKVEPVVSPRVEPRVETRVEPKVEPMIEPAIEPGITTEPPPTIVPPGLFLGGKRERRMFRLAPFIKSRAPKGYTPSVTAAALGIRGRQPKMLTGLELRPLEPRGVRKARKKRR